jgi:hypothetical protein
MVALGRARTLSLWGATLVARRGEAQRLLRIVWIAYLSWSYGFPTLRTAYTLERRQDDPGSAGRAGLGCKRDCFVAAAYADCMVAPQESPESPLRLEVSSWQRGRPQSGYLHARRSDAAPIRTSTNRGSYRICERHKPTLTVSKRTPRRPGAKSGLAKRTTSAPRDLGRGKATS